jgi:hypothetical protein
MTINIEKHCRLDREPSDGRRILVTRFWPRRMARDRIDAWYKDLGPSIDLFRRFKALANTTGLTERARAKQHHLLWRNTVPRFGSSWTFCRRFGVATGLVRPSHSFASATTQQNAIGQFSPRSSWKRRCSGDRSRYQCSRLQFYRCEANSQ